MTALAWDKVGERVFQTGVDRGVLYLNDGASVVWNGLTGIDENHSVEIKSSYLNGLKYLQYAVLGDFSGSLKALTYPDEFDSVMGIVEIHPGLSYYDQPHKSFSLSYRTRIGDDVLGTELGYKLHILYDLLANSDAYSFVTQSESSDAMEFSWTLSASPVILSGHRPTSHLVVDSRTTPSETLAALEEILYGTGSTDPILPSVGDILDLFSP
jgi:hypothetical protein